MGKTHRTTISIPLDLKERMGAAEGQVNWSAVAARAFELELARIATMKGRTMAKEDVITRLKAAAEAEGHEDEARGKKDGREWAEQVATPRQLKRLQAWHDGFGVDWGRTSEEPDGGHVFMAMNPTANPGSSEGRAAMKEFWETATGEDFEEFIDSWPYISSFVEEALNVWSEVQDQL